MYFSNSEFLGERDSSLLVDFDYDQNLCEYEQNSASPLLKGTLKTNLEYWHTIGANNFVIDTIKFGYWIPLISTPCRALFHNNKSALENASFVESAISELVGNHSVIEVPFVPHVVSQSSGKKRLILDLRHVNQSIWKQKFKCEDWRVLLSYVNKGDFLFRFDLKPGYHHFDIFPDHQVLSNIFALLFFLLVLVRPLTFSPNALHPLLSFGGLMALK